MVSAPRTGGRSRTRRRSSGREPSLPDRVLEARCGRRETWSVSRASRDPRARLVVRRYAPGVSAGGYGSWRDSAGVASGSYCTVAGPRHERRGRSPWDLSAGAGAAGLPYFCVAVPIARITRGERPHSRLAVLQQTLTLLIAAATLRTAASGTARHDAGAGETAALVM